jgi:hypothetical protein
MHLSDVADHLLQNSRDEVLEWFQEKIAGGLTEEKIETLRKSLSSCPDYDLQNELISTLNKIADTRSWFRKLEREW